MSHERLNHDHPCQHCGRPVVCGGAWMRNYEGFPYAICSEYHLDTGVIAFVQCGWCWAKENLLCALEDSEYTAWPPAWIYEGASLWTAPREGSSGLA